MPGKEGTPLILGLILGDRIEINLIRAIMADDNLWLFATRPISGVCSPPPRSPVAPAIWQHLRHQKRTLGDEDLDMWAVRAFPRSQHTSDGVGRSESGQMLDKRRALCRIVPRRGTSSRNGSTGCSIAVGGWRLRHL
jgi:hypothetical protein